MEDQELHKLRDKIEASLIRQKYTATKIALEKTEKTQGQYTESEIKAMINAHKKSDLFQLQVESELKIAIARQNLQETIEKGKIK